MKRFCVLILMCVMFLSLSGCGREDTSLSDVLQRGVYTVGVYEDCEPFCFFDEDGEASGFDVDINREIAKRLGVSLELKKADADNITALIATDKVDCSSNNIMLARKSKDLKPTKTMFNYKMVMATRDESEFCKISDFGKKNIAFLSDSAFATEFDANSALDTTAVPAGCLTENDAFTALSEGDADAVITSEISAEHRRARGEKIKTLEKPLKKQAYTSVFEREDKALIKRVGEIIEEMKNDGTMRKIAEKWFPSNSFK